MIDTIQKKKAMAEQARRAIKNKFMSFFLHVPPAGKYIFGRHTVTMISKIQTAVENIELGISSYIIFNVHPRSGKSDVVSRRLPAWAAIRRPEWEIILASYNYDLATDMSIEARKCYKMVAPMFNLGTSNDRDQVACWKTDKGGGMYATGLGGTVNGRGGTLIIVDDYFKNREEAESHSMRNKVWESLRHDLMTRRAPVHAIIMAATRWHDDDVCGRIEKVNDPSRPEYDKDFPKFEIVKFPAQSEDGSWLFPERFSEEWYRQAKAIQGTYGWDCTPAETPILMADWTCKKISDVKAGDKVIGFERGTKEKRARLVISEVKNTFSKIGQVQKITMESGRVVRCTSNHKWYTRRREGSEGGGNKIGRKEYSPATLKRGGNRLMFVCPVSDSCTHDEQRLWDYLAGIIDGEGHVERSILSISQSSAKNPDVYDNIKRVLDSLGLTYNEQKRKAHKDMFRNCSEASLFQLHNVRDVYRKIIRLTSCAKADRMREKLIKHSHMFIRERDKITEIVQQGMEPVYALETTTGNYIAWGYASSNSQFQQNPTPRLGNRFRVDKVHYVDDIEETAKKLVGDVEWEWGFDLAHSDKETNKDDPDYTHGTLGTMKDRIVFIKDVLKCRKSALERDRLITEKVLSSNAQKATIEVVGAAKDAYNILKNALSGQVMVHKYTVSHDLPARASFLEPVFEAGNVYVQKAEWNKDWESIFRTFPNGTHDDDIASLVALCYKKLARTGAMSISN